MNAKPEQPSQDAVNGENSLKDQLQMVWEINDTLHLLQVSLNEYLFDTAAPKEGYADSEACEKCDRLMHDAWVSLKGAIEAAKDARFIARKDGGF